MLKKTPRKAVICIFKGLIMSSGTILELKLKEQHGVTSNEQESSW
jgi:hypothetical protein